MTNEKQRNIWRKARKKYYNKNKNEIIKKMVEEYPGKYNTKYAKHQKIRAKTRYDNEKTGICYDCNELKKTQFHHLSYKPNIFIELCRGCHNERHRKDM